MINPDDHLMERSINLWSALVDLDRDDRRDDRGRIREGDLQSLGFNSRYHMQEFTVQAVKGGWEIRIFGADIEDCGCVEIFIPHDCREPCQILKDRIGMREYHH